MLSTTLDDIRSNCFGKNHSLPAQCYTDERFLALEKDMLFTDGWLCAGRADEVPEVGDYFTITIMGEPLLVVRTEKKTVSVHANVCRHRGMPVATGAGNTQRFVCPYHAWTYQLDGKLKSAPLMRNKATLKDCQLPSVRSECWRGFIFVCFDDTTTSINESLKSLDAVIGNYQMENMHHIASFHEVWDCNWKSLTENFMDAYHLSVVHPGSLRPLTPTNLCEPLAHGEGFTSYIANYARAAPARECHAKTLTDAETRQSRLFCIYPAMIASVSPDTVAYYFLQPCGVDKVQIKWGIAVFEEDLSHEERAARIEKWQQINREDHRVLRELQAGLRSSFYHGGSLAPARLEGCVRHFHDNLIEALSRE